MTLATPLLSLSCVLFAVGCNSSTSGLHADLSAQMSRHHATADASGLTFQRANGDSVHVTRGYVTLAEVEIVACPESAVWRFLRSLSPIGTAFAHSEGSPTVLGVPNVLSARAEPDDIVALGSLHPPPGDYCALRLTFAPADEDAEGMPDDVDMDGWTLWLDAEITPAGGGPMEVLHLTSVNTETVDVAFDAVSLQASSPEGEVLLTLAPELWLDGVNVVSPAAGDDVLTQIVASTFVPVD